MPADYNFAAAAGNKTLSAAEAAQQLGMDTSSSEDTPFRDEDDGDEDDERRHPSASEQSVPWARQPSGHTTTASSRLSTRPYSLTSRAGGPGDTSSPSSLRGQLTSLTAQTVEAATKAYHQSSEMYTSLPRTQQILVAAAAALLFAAGITLLVFSHRIFTLLGPVAVSWRGLPGGWLIIWALTFFVAFPPLIGYSTACTVAGFVYGFPLGWPIVASATVLGSSAAFLASRTVFSGYVDRLVGHDRRFVALGQVLRHDGLGVLALVRFCPLPYSLSNGFLATVPSVRPLSFALATALSSPKLLVHVFIGSRLALLAEKGDEMTFGDRLVNFMSMVVGGTVGMGVGYFIYRRTMARAAEIAREETEAEAGGAGAGAAGVSDGYVDDGVEGGEDARLMDPGDAAALMVDDDDISLWDTAGDDGGFGDDDVDAQGRYRDEEEAVGGGRAGRKGNEDDDDPWS